MIGDIFSLSKKIDSLTSLSRNLSHYFGSAIALAVVQFVGWNVRLRQIAAYM
jgi:hypothetical protein